MESSEKLRPSSFDKPNSGHSISYFKEIFSPIKVSDFTAKVAEPKAIQFDITNTINLKFPEDMPKDTALTLLMCYGDIDKISYAPNGELEISFTHILSAQKAFNELKYNFKKFDSALKVEDFISYSSKNFAENFFISLDLNSNIPFDFAKFQNLQCLLFYFMKISKIYKVFLNYSTTNQMHLLIQFENLKDKNLVEFMLKRWTETSLIDSKENVFSKMIINSNISSKVNFPDLSTYGVLYSYNKALETECISQVEIIPKILDNETLDLYKHLSEQGFNLFDPNILFCSFCIF